MKRAQPPITEIGSETEAEEKRPKQEQILETKIKEETRSNKGEDSSTGQNSTIAIETTDQSEAQRPANPPRRRNRNRHKTDFFGHNIMITQITSNPRSEEDEEEN